MLYYCHRRRSLSTCYRFKDLKALETASLYARPPPGSIYSLSVAMFCDGGRSAESGHVSHIGSLSVGLIQARFFFHVILWSSHKALRPAKSIRAAEILAACVAIDLRKYLAKSYCFCLMSAPTCS